MFFGQLAKKMDRIKITRYSFIALENLWDFFYKHIGRKRGNCLQVFSHSAMFGAQNEQV
jgi:hypothetical protein